MIMIALAATESARRLPRLFVNLLEPRVGEAIELRLAVVIRDAPFGHDVAFLLQLQQRRIERAVIDREQIAARLLDAPRDAVAVERPEDFQRFQHHQCERALPDICAVSHECSYGTAIACRMFLWGCNINLFKSNIDFLKFVET
jgi:hypothetical protein